MRTEQDIRQEIAEVQAAKRAVLSGQEYSFSDGQSSQSVKRVNYDDLVKRENELWAELDDVLGNSKGGFYGYF